jgi:hypothetical protein
MKTVLIIAGLVGLGIAAGYAYYYFIGCSAGNTCPITSNPLSSMAYGGLLGGVIGLNFLPSKKQTEK